MSQYSDSKFNPDDSNTSWQKTFNLIPEKSSVLDIGCSSGTFGERLIKEKKCIVDGIEISDEDIRVAEKKLREVFKINIESDDINIQRKYDVVFMGDTIEHLARPINALKKIKKVLKKDGVLVFSIPNITHMYVRLMLMRGEINYGKTGLLDETHLHFYNSKEVYRVFNAAGYKIDIFDYTVNDMPEEILKDELNKIGLSMDTKFKKLAQTIDAAAYQFIGVAKSEAIKHQDLPEISPLNLIHQYHQRLRKQYDTNVKGLIADRDRVLREVNKLKTENERLLTENHTMKEKLSVKVKRYIKKKIN